MTGLFIYYTIIDGLSWCKCKKSEVSIESLWLILSKNTNVSQFQPKRVCAQFWVIKYNYRLQIVQNLT